MLHQIATISVICISLGAIQHPVARPDAQVRPPEVYTVLIGQTETFMLHGIAVRTQLITATHKETGAMHVLASAGPPGQVPTRRMQYRHSIITGAALRDDHLFVASITANSFRRTPPWVQRHRRGPYATHIEVFALADLRRLGSCTVPATPMPADLKCALEGGVLTASGAGVRIDNWRVAVDLHGTVIVEAIESDPEPAQQVQRTRDRGATENREQVTGDRQNNNAGSNG